MTDDAQGPNPDPVPESTGWATPPAPPAPPPAPEPSAGGWELPKPPEPVPGGGWVAPPPVSARKTSPFRSAATRARWLVGLLLLNVVASIVGVAVDLWGKKVITDFEAGAATQTDLERFDELFAQTSILDLGVFLIAAIAWLAWSSRTVDNEDALGIGPSKVSPRLTIAWWFLPLANLVMPYLVHREIFQRYHRGISAGAGLVTIWWLVYVGSNLFEYAVGTIWSAADTFPTLQSGLTLYVASGLWNAVAAIVAIVLVQRIQRRADVLAASGGAPTDAIPPIPTTPGPTAT